MDNTNAYMYPIINATHTFSDDIYDFYYIENKGRTYYVAYNKNEVIDLKKETVEIVDKWDIGKVLLIEQNKKNIKLLKKGKLKPGK